MTRILAPARLVMLIASLLLTTACASDRAIFVTTTNIGVDADTLPPKLSLAYDRFEGFYGPAFEDGELPTVVARLESNQSVLDPRAKQVYATGDAAAAITAPAVEVDPAEPDPLRVSRSRRVAFFGVSSVTGLKIAFNPASPATFESVSFGYKRKEISVLPLIEEKDEDGDDIVSYPSTLASITLNTNARGQTDASIGVIQFFATGAAAENLAKSDSGVRRAFGAEFEEAAIRSTLARIRADEAAQDRISTFLNEQKSGCRSLVELAMSDACAKERAALEEREGISLSLLLGGPEQ